MSFVLQSGPDACTLAVLRGAQNVSRRRTNPALGWPRYVTNLRRILRPSHADCCAILCGSGGWHAAPGVKCGHSAVDLDTDTACASRVEATSSTHLQDHFESRFNEERDLSSRKVMAVLEQALTLPPAHAEPSDDKNSPWTNLQKAQRPHENPCLDHSFSSTDTESTVEAAPLDGSPKASWLNTTLDPQSRSFEQDMLRTSRAARNLPLPSTPARPVQAHVHVSQGNGDRASTVESAASGDARGQESLAREPLRELVVRPRPLQSLPFV